MGGQHHALAALPPGKPRNHGTDGLDGTGIQFPDHPAYGPLLAYIYKIYDIHTYAPTHTYTHIHRENIEACFFWGVLGDLNGSHFC